MPVCSACGQENPELARFCLACGEPLRGGQHAEERRVVTVLFADLVGFTARAERLDPEDVRAILRPYHARVRDELERFGGTVEKFAGDAVMAVFGAQVAHGDDPERAVRAGLAVRGALRDLNERSPGLELEVRVGINTGEAIVTLAADAVRGEAMVAGDVVNTAQRLQAAAPENGIAVGAETYGATRSAIDYRALEPIEAKGKSAPLRAWLALAAHTAVGERSLSGVPMVGRTRELAVLREIWQNVAEQRRSHLATVFGPAGIGKSRLAVELAEHVAASGGRTIRGRCLAYGESSPYGAFAQQVKQVARVFDNDELPVAHEKLLAAVAELAGEGDADATTAHLALLLGLRSEETVAEWETLFFSARLVVEGLAAQQPTVLLFEDIHWADPSLLTLIELLAARVSEVPLLLTLARPELRSIRPGWPGGLATYTGLGLEPLADDDASALAALLLRQHAAADAEGRASTLARTAEGNPLFIEELAASVAERAASGGAELPTSIRGIVTARLALPAVERGALLDAAVVGKVFWRGALARVRPDDDDLPVLLGSLEERDLIRREAVSRIRGDQQYVFKHGLIRDVAYQTLPRAERRLRHAEVARFLEDTTPGLGDPP